MDQIEIAIGTYENLILGYRIEETVGEEGYCLESSFTTDSHCGALRCLGVSPQGVLVSSSTDDSIRLHSLKKRREVGSLFQHDGSVNCIRFFKGGHMFSASEDGTICLWKCKNWELLRVFKGHKCHVMAISVHPSGKLALSIGNDRTFFTWDMTTGKLAFKRKTDEVAQDILFTHDGNHYVLVYQKKIEVFSLEDTAIIQEIKCNSRINMVCFVEENILAVGRDDGVISIVDVMSNTQLLQKTFKGRVRCMCTLTTEMDLLLFVASSTGHIWVCKLDLTVDDASMETVLEYNSGTRLTCMTVYAPPDVLKSEKEEDKSVASKENVKIKPKKKRKAAGTSKTDKDEVVSINEGDEIEDEAEEDIMDKSQNDDCCESEEATDQIEKEEETVQTSSSGKRKKTTQTSKMSAKKRKIEKSPQNMKRSQADGLEPKKKKKLRNV